MDTTPTRAGQVLRYSALALVLLLLCRASFAVPLDASAGSARRAAAFRAEPMRIIRNVRYGSDIRQRFDVYAPGDTLATRNAPIIFMVHGGGWAFGDKAARGVVDNKVARWVPRGFIVVSTNYRMLPAADPIEQARDVARAIAVAQQRAASWGGDRTKLVLMGHSAGAHLVTLLATTPSLSSDLPLAPWLGVVSIESGALDVVAIMRAPHARLYDRAFGHDSAYWRAASPFDALKQPASPMLIVCSIQRANGCAQADRFAAKAISLGGRASVLREDLSHAEADARLGLDRGYTSAVESFLRSLDPALERQLPADSTPVRRQ